MSSQPAVPDSLAFFASVGPTILRYRLDAHIVGLNIDDDPARFVPAGLSFFRISEDGRLSQFKFHEIATGGHQLFWTGIVPLTAPGHRREY